MKKSLPNCFPFGKINYLLLLCSLLFIIAGYTAMLLDKTLYGFGYLSLIVGPILLMIGFLLPFGAIMYQQKNK